MTEQGDPSPSAAMQATVRLARPRRIIAMVLLALCLLWPMGSLSQMRTYLMNAQPTPAQATQGWHQLERRMEPVRRFLTPGTLVEYAPTTQISVAASRPIDVQFVLTPVIVWRPGQPGRPMLIVADMIHDAELTQFITQESLEPVALFGAGLAILKRTESPQEGSP